LQLFSDIGFYIVKSDNAHFVRLACVIRRLGSIAQNCIRLVIATVLAVLLIICVIHLANVALRLFPSYVVSSVKFS
jgi:hypothetical protein